MDGNNLDDNQLRKQALALDQGKSYSAALDFMKGITSSAEEKAGNYIVTVACEAAEGMYMIQPEGDLQWNIPQEHENQHLEVAIRDKDDLRFIPYLMVYAEVRTLEGNVVAGEDLPFIWHPFLYHYGANIFIPEESDYLVTVRVEKAFFQRHDEEKGNRYLNEVIVEIGPIHLKPGRKEYGAE